MQDFISGRTGYLGLATDQCGVFQSYTHTKFLIKFMFFL